MPPAAAARLPADRAGATALLGVPLDEDWPLPDILDLMPVYAPHSASEAPFGIWVMIEAQTNAVVGDVGFLAAPYAAGEMLERAGFERTSSTPTVIRWRVERLASRA